MSNRKEEEFGLNELFVAIVLIIAAFSIGSVINQL